MRRRRFLRASAATFAAVAIGGRPGSGSAATRKAPADALPRLVLPINRGWRYLDSCPSGFESRDFDDAAFARVCLPHANRLLPWHGFDEGATQFVSAYRRWFRLPAAAAGHRVYVDFEGVMTAATVWVNGVRLGEYRGGYTPFSFEISAHLRADGANLLAVAVDSTERADIPPFGGIVDYLAFGGIYREVSLRVVPPAHIANLHAMPRDVLAARPVVDVRCELEDPAGIARLEATVYDGERAVGRGSAPVVGAMTTVRIEGLEGIRHWSIDEPVLYRAVVRAWAADGSLVDADERRLGFRHAEFTPAGFMLNGEPLKLRGLNRHQTYPWVGGAMPARVQREDAWILRHEYKCNIVRTSHYPQSRHFLDACDELGLLVLEEIPGWQHIGDAAWKDLAVDNLARMVRRDWNHPSIVLWGVRINESGDDHDFYARTNALARALDPSRQTCGVRYLRDSELLEDVFTVNDFGFPLQEPNHPAYLNTEFVGHTFPAKSFDNAARLAEHTLRHARVHDQIAGSRRHAGGLGWCAFDYNTHANFGAGDHVCYHGVGDIFRNPKPAAGFYRSQCSPREELVLEPAFHWSTGDDYEWLKQAVVCSNCERLAVYLDGKLVAESGPDRARFPHLAHPPFVFDLYDAAGDTAQDLRIDGLIGGQVVITHRSSGKSVDRRFELRAAADRLRGDGSDATRVSFRVTDEYGSLKPYATGAIQFSLEGPGVIVGENPFSLVGGAGAVWVRAGEQAGTIRLRARHPVLGDQELALVVEPAPAEIA